MHISARALSKSQILLWKQKNTVLPIIMTWGIMRLCKHWFSLDDGIPDCSDLPVCLLSPRDLSYGPGASFTYSSSSCQLLLWCFVRPFPYPSLFLKKDFVCSVLERGEEGERNVVVSHMPSTGGPGRQPRHVPGLGIELATLWFTAYA